MPPTTQKLAPPTTGSAGSPDRRPARQGRVKGSRSLPAWGFLTPAIVLFVVFMALPIGYAAYLSLRTVKVSGLGLGAGARTETWAGFSNYARALSDPEFLASVGRVGLYGLLLVPTMIVLALLFALLLDSRGAHAGPGRIGVLLEGNGQGRCSHHRLAQVHQPSLATVRQGDFQQRAPGPAQLQQGQPHQRLVVLRLRLILFNQTHDQLAQQVIHLQHLDLAVQRRRQGRAQVDIAHLQVADHANAVGHPRWQPHRALGRHHQRLAGRLDPHHPAHGVQQLAPDMLMRLDKQPARVGARQGLHRHIGIAEVGGRGKGHDKARD